ncbi:DUF1592 domain-containing protein [Nannocystis sp. SCPEA4]|uniref:DUF1592 domain-containing protein n=1 Tax=Nannocystis sp. SCPEA4 TaxID=2996787 RepID=UPI00226DAEFE|nr:DUF1592 domain-containing protein [Nannocystis sp. SCPEA4]MCY1057352.1 DUF1592 domain-containing protein [Nannocystis sp. SCPEA4]
MRGIVVWAIAAAAIGGCQNGPGGDGDANGETDSDGVTDGVPAGATEGGEAAECRGIEPGPSPIRRMNRREYDNTVFDLLGDDSRPAQNFPAEEEALGFNNNADALVVTSLLAEGYLAAAEALAENAVKDLSALLHGCDVKTDGEAACAERFITEFGRSAYRRPLAADEVKTLLAVHQAAADEFDFATGVRLTMTAMLQSPHFLYRVEFGEPMSGSDDILKLAPYELASRLSYFLWGTMPDAELFAAAAEGRLEEPEDVANQATRMLADARARATVRDFHGQWLELRRIEEMEKDDEAFPEFDPEIRPLLRAEAENFLDHVIWDDQGDLDSIYLAPYTFLNGELADYYGIKGPNGDAFEKFDLPAGQGSGFLTQGGLLSVLAKPNQTSPIHRGKFVRERLLCQVVPPPPDNVDITPPEVDPTLPTRERFKQHSVDPTCSGCHSMMDPVGFGFEHFDGIGRWRDEEAGKPVDASGEIIGATTKGTFDGVPELAALLVDSPETERCMTLQWFRYAYGRADADVDACTVDDLTRQFAGSGRRIQDLIVALTQSEAFLYRRAPEGE